MQAKPYWPLAGYYAYLDTGVYDSLNFGELGLLYTDELGALHHTDSDGRPTRLVTHFAFAWSTIYQDSDIETSTLIYDYDLNRLKQRKQQVEAAGQKSALAAKYKVTRQQLTRFAPQENAYPTGAYITVPQDDDVLPLSKLEAFMGEQDENLKKAQAAQDKIQHWITLTTDNQVMYFHRQQINDWLYKPGEGRRKHLYRVHGGTHDGDTRWDLACHTFDIQLEKRIVAFEDCLDRLFDVFQDNQKVAMLGQIGLIVDNWDDPNGDFLLWRHQFILEAASLFAGSRRSKEVFDKVVQPVAESLANPFTLQRVKCTCPTCSLMVEGKTAFDEESFEKLTHYKGWEAKDLRIGTRTAQRALDLFTRFGQNFAWATVYTGVAKSKLLANGAIVSWWFFVRSGIVGPNVSSESVGNQWLQMIADMTGDAKKGEGELDVATKRITDFLKTKISRTATLNLDIVGDLFGVAGAAILTYSVLSKHGKLDPKGAVDLSRAIVDATRAGGNIYRRSLEKALIQQLGEEEGARMARALPKYVRWTQATRYLGVVGGGLQVASSFLSLQEAAEKGDKREFGWVAVQYAGSDIAFSGLVLDACPEPVVTKGSGIVLNVVGGIVIVVGAAGEFFTRPDAEQAYLQNGAYFGEGEYGPE